MDVELVEGAGELESLIAKVEKTGERVRLTADNEPARVLLPAAELAELEYWAARQHRGARPASEPAHQCPPGPTAYGPYVGYSHPHGGMTVTRGRVVVAELRDAETVAWLEEQAMYGRQGYMGPKQSAAFAEFLARWAPVGDEQGATKQRGSRNVASAGQGGQGGQSE
ncbi:type II toxin-antitoxin system Phd/YefM family antitoxin [Streptomyces actinomycinicus]|uniref:Type II toxin-antitoxin system Phd/YefM family antitoxin n=1 Tax=Streptomyces actinomycinicus TaxID=1695166 RepID=A0A937EK46_9ACTN|nr:type II toxin-antitoxin system Phd/YefM family antitoxin [Streptomyces actinomycinicus]MBL1083596.1 type II toxin-antitoxin system Phd/YefM family antitoxin [Streptomyces actinomycinicus]